MDYRHNGPNSLLPPASSNGAFTRRHTAAGAHEFSSPQQPITQHIPAYGVEHLASFAVGKLFGLITPTDGIRKLQQMERNSAICPVPMLFTLHPDRVAVLEENGALVEEFPLSLVTDPSAHISTDTSDLFNNVLLFVVREHDVPNRSGGVVPTEMHIFQCIGVSAQEVAGDLHHYTRGHFHKVKPGRRGGAANSAFGASRYAPYHASGQIERGTGYPNGNHLNRDDLSGESDSTEFFEMDVNTLNRCFDDIERFVVRIQSAAIAQRELELQQRSNSKKKGRKKSDIKLAQQNSILQLRAQIPSYGEFTEIFRKFKLCFNLLAKLKNHIHEPSAPELLHFLFTPLTVILDACQWGLGQQVAQQVYSPLLSLETCELLRTYLFPKEMDVWNALGKAWNTAPEDWVGQLPPPYRPLFLDGFAPYGHSGQTGGLEHSNWDNLSNGSPATSYPQHHLRYGGSVPAPIHRGVSAPVPSREFHPSVANGGGGYFSPPSTRSNDNNVSLANLAAKLDSIELARINLEKERLEFERRKVLDKERQLLEQEQRLRDEAERLDEERRNLHRESEKRSIAESDRPDFYRGIPSMHASPRLDRHSGSIQVLPSENNRQHNLGPTTPPSNLSGNTTFDGSSNINISSGSPRLSNSNSMQLLEQNSPRQKAFLDELSRRGSKVVQVTYDRNACNSKELTVSRGEYLEVLNDSRNWWECRNVHSRSGFVPHTILSLLAFEDWDQQSDEVDDSLNARIVVDNNRPTNNLQHKQKTQRFSTPGSAATGPSHSSSSNSSTPDLIRQRTVLNLDKNKLTVSCIKKPKILKIPVEVRMEQRHVPQILESMRRKGFLFSRGIPGLNTTLVASYIPDAGFAEPIERPPDSCVQNVPEGVQSIRSYL
uniref:SH3 domain-containing protein n=1 Tax=Meloidogyne incognita TaxID=6306 RepID=A0A914LQS6_MELIC